MRRGFALAGGADADVARLLAELRQVRRAEITHAALDAAEGIEALKEASGPVDRVLAQLIGGIQSGMGYLGAKNLEQLRTKARYIRVSPAGQREAAPHDVVELKTGN